MSEVYNITIFMSKDKIAKGKIYKSWTPFNYDKIISSFPLKTRIYYIGNKLIYLPLNTRFKPEKNLEKIERGQILILYYLNSLSIPLEKQKLYRYKATLIGEITEGLENLKSLRRGDIVTVTGERSDK